MQRLLILFLAFLMFSPLSLALIPSTALAQIVAPTPYPRLERPLDEAYQPTQPDPSPQIASPIITGPAQPLTLVARISETGPIISQGLVWRIFEAEPDENGNMILLKKSEQAIAKLSIDQGNYIIHASYGRAQASETINVGKEPTNKTLILNSGALRLNAAITGDISIRSSLLKFDISTSSLDPNERVLIAKDIKPNKIINLNAGNYFVVSYFGETNATVSADIKVEPGQITDATLFHRAGLVSFKLVSEAGGREIADVDWTIKNADNKIIHSSINAFPSAILSEGDYVVIAKRGQNVYNRDFSVIPGPAREIELLISVY